MGYKETELLKEKVYQLQLTNRSQITFTDQDIQQIKSEIKSIIQEKQKESLHQLDNTKEEKRWLTGMLGELAVEKYLNISFRDSSVGNSNLYNVPDLEKSGYNIGVKSSMFPNFPVINRTITYPQIFVLIRENPYRGIILGLADMDLIQENLQDKTNDDLIYVKAMLSRKTAFSKLDQLKPIKTTADLEPYQIKKLT